MSKRKLKRTNWKRRALENDRALCRHFERLVRLRSDAYVLADRITQTLKAIGADCKAAP